MRRKKEEFIFPAFYRKLEFEYFNGEHRYQPGVYCIFFGEMFYIGMAGRIAQRISKHKSVINALIGSSVRGKPETNGSYTTILEYLIANPGIKTAEVYILDVCDTREDALSMEDSYLYLMRCHFLNYRCLNKIWMYEMDVPDLMKW